MLLYVLVVACVEMHEPGERERQDRGYKFNISRGVLCCKVRCEGLAAKPVARLLVCALG